LRTLPLAPTRLAALLVCVAVLPLIALGALVAGIAGVIYGAPLAVMALKGYLLIIAPTAVCVFLSLGRLEGKLTFLFCLLVMAAFCAAPVWLLASSLYREIPVVLVGLVVLISVLLAFLLTRFALIYSSRIYRGQEPAGSTSLWTGGK